MSDFTIEQKGIDAIQRDMYSNAKDFRKNFAKGLAAGCLIVIRRAKKQYLRGAKGEDVVNSRTLRSTMAYKVSEAAQKATVGWYKSVWAHVVADPTDSRTSTTITPKKAKMLFFPLTRRAINVWHLRRGKIEHFTTRKRKGIILGNRRLYEGQDFVFARKTVVKPRRPAAKAYRDEQVAVTKAIIDRLITIEKK